MSPRTSPRTCANEPRRYSRQCINATCSKERRKAMLLGGTLFFIHFLSFSITFRTILQRELPLLDPPAACLIAICKPCRRLVDVGTCRDLVDALAEFHSIVKIKTFFCVSLYRGRTLCCDHRSRDPPFCTSFHRGSCLLIAGSESMESTQCHVDLALRELASC